MIIPFNQLENDLYEFEELLKSISSDIDVSDDIENIILSSTKLLDQYKKIIEYDNSVDIRPIYRNLLGIHDFVFKLKVVINHPEISQLIPHLKLFEKSIIQQNIKTPITDSGANKIFELYISLACMRLSNYITLDNPDNSKGDNPDIIFNHNNINIGIACKAIHSDNPEALISNTIKAIDQIEKSNSDIGLVLVNIKNYIKHDLYWPIINHDKYIDGEEPEFGAYSSIDFAIKELDKYGMDYYHYMNNDELIKKELLKIFNNKKTPPEIYLFLNSTCGIIKEDSIPAMNIKHLMQIKIIEDKKCQTTKNIASSINHYLQYGV